MWLLPQGGDCLLGSLGGTGKREASGLMQLPSGLIRSLAYSAEGEKWPPPTLAVTGHLAPLLASQCLESLLRSYFTMTAFLQMVFCAGNQVLLQPQLVLADLGKEKHQAGPGLGWATETQPPTSWVTHVGWG